MSKRSEELARQFEEAVANLAKAIQNCSEKQWQAVCNDEGWTVAQTAQHVSGQFPLEMTFITAGAEGRPLPGLTGPELNEKNESRADKNKSVTKAAVLEELKTGAASVAAYIRGLTDEQLDHKEAFGLADGAVVSTQQLIEGGVLIAHVTDHTESIRTATEAAASRI